MKALTWYPGTVLPYASLWHTVCRAAWLNRLRAIEVENIAIPRRAPKPRSHSAIHPSIDLGKFAAALGERRGAFKGSTLGPLPPWILERYIVPRIRWCPECIEQGFHSILGAVCLVFNCPIHGCPLVDRCRECNGVFKASIREACTVGSTDCRCGRTRLMSPAACRHSTLPAQLSPKWKSVADWLANIQTVFQPQQGIGRPEPWLQELSLELTPRWCEDLNIPYPECFMPEDALHPTGMPSYSWRAYRAGSGNLDGKAGTVAPEQDTGSWKDCPETRVYRGMARHLRRHATSRPERWTGELIKSEDPAVFAETIRDRNGARLAFVDMVWSRILEPEVHLRRWPTRNPQWSDPRDLSSWDADSAYRSISIQGPELPNGLDQRVGIWLRHHALGMAAQVAWEVANRRADDAIDKSWADWSASGSYMHGRVFWFARVHAGRVHFVGYLRNSDPPAFRSTLIRKPERIAELARQRLRRLAHVRQCCKGPCLTWSERNGWEVLNDLEPENEDIRPLRLLHVGRPDRFWLFTSHGQFVARACEEHLQGIGCSPHGAISALRKAVVQHRNRYGQICAARKEGVLPKPATPTSVALAALPRYLVRTLGPQGGQDKFWTTSSVAIEAAQRTYVMRLGALRDSE